MGMQISNFSTFLSLCDRSWASPVVDEIFSQFKLTVIVLCDPNNPDFIDKFDTLDRMTGPDLLFITFAKSPKHQTRFSKWFAEQKKKNQKLLDQKKLHRETLGRLNCLSKASQTNDIEIADLARRFNLQPSHLPALVITNDLRGKKAVVMRTTREQIGNHLTHLTLEVADRSTPIDLHDLDYVKNNPDAVFCSFRAGTSNILTDFFCRQQLKNDPNDIGAQVWNDKTVSESVQKLSAMDDTTETALAEREEELMDYAASRAAQAQNTSAIAVHNRFIIDENKMQGVENDTLVTLRTYNLLTQLFVSRPENKLPESFKYDYSALSLYLSKVLENELAYSIVQQMRLVKGIPMPDYYCKLFKGKNDADYKVKIAPDKAVDLNKKQGRYWVAPALGEMRMAYQKLAADGEKLYTFDNVFLDNIWQPMILERNKAAHRNPIDWVSFDTAFNYFRFFLDGGYFHELVGLKKQLKNREKTDSFGNGLTLFES